MWKQLIGILIVMITALNYVQVLFFYNINQAMFNGYTAAPESGKLPFEWFRLSNSFKGGAHHIPDKFINMVKYLLNPVPATSDSPVTHSFAISVPY